MLSQTGGVSPARYFFTVAAAVIVASVAGCSDGDKASSSAADTRADTAPLGEEVILTGPGMTPLSHRGMNVARAVDGSFITVWGGIGAAGEDIYARLFSADGEPRGDSFPVGAGSSAIRPAVAMDAAGNFVVAWITVTVLNNHDDVLFRRFDADGHPLGETESVPLFSGLLDQRWQIPGAPFIILDEGQTWMSLAMNPAGDFVIAWRRRIYSFFDCCTYTQSRTLSNATYVRPYAADGTPRRAPAIVGAQFPLLSSAQSDLDIAMDDEGRFAVVWSESHELNETSLIRRYRADGRALELGQPIAAASGGPVARLSIGMDASGDHVVAWFDRDSDSAWGQRFGADGTPAGKAFQLADEGRTFAQIAMAPAGHFAVAWPRQERDDVGRVLRQQVVLRCYAADGTPRGEVFQVNQIPVGATTPFALPISLAYDGFGDLLVAWNHRAESAPDDIRARRFTDC